jgi:hypothetical protein
MGEAWGRLGPLECHYENSVLLNDLVKISMIIFFEDTESVIWGNSAIFGSFEDTGSVIYGFLVKIYPFYKK